ncbi:MAG: hypothetical protein AAB368_14445 [bacterium]
MIVTHARPADAIPQLAGRDVPGGSVLYTCSGANEHGKKCGKLLCIWMPPAPPGDGTVESDGTFVPEGVDHGSVEIKCRRCKTLNVVPLSSVDLD